ncbi:hypothetical protein TPHA_0A02250 [Tetrapisispora phaffii CBS 4417]|uniref:Arrestin C-terminal-like domain-containing protein n=1 Tax=Tetrapisispora phaffii (strain ATCC 24235 / CBS 4417 / NBRC 1672 / NRRL Y-8282 / UCD 70-5) TaxID=1071381 RepID=G8BN29_TETPH|nr:hypothetical protein TPHA_0A02250 [Tetrapisispora phaffii CBS 4417]CCE61307.1 hypothetical protein TPHA_0A02250 [Tetrapisispora phaffii CBS 4417]
MFSAYTKSSSKAPLLFDIRLNSIDNSVNSNGVIVINGIPENAPSIFLSGTIVFSICEPVYIKGVHLSLEGKLRLNIPNLKLPATSSATDSTSKVFRYSKFEKRIYTHNWDNINIQNYFQNLYSNYGNKNYSISSPKEDLKNSTKPRSRSNASLASLTTTSSGSNYCTLLPGNYEFPFSAILPGSLTESVEGFPNGCVRYSLRASIERGRGENDLICEKNIRIVRTLSPDVVELSETVFVQNEWPKKIEYDISVRSKAIAIGSTIPIKFHMIPILKGLKLGPIRISLIESSQYCGSQGIVIHQERIIKKLKIKDPLGHVNIYHKKTQGKELTESELLNEQTEFQDFWDIDTDFTIPPSLSQCTQDCNILSNIKIRHKFKVNISLMNPDGHISELRASVPIQLYISTFLPLGINRKEINEPGHIVVDGIKATDNLKSNPLKVKNSNIVDDDTIFGSNEQEILTPNNEICDTLYSETSSSSQQNISSLMAPPKYEKHKKSFSIDSSMSSPLIEEHNFSSNPTESFLLLSDESHLEQLNYRLEMLHMEREKSVTSLNSKFNPFKSINMSGIDVEIKTPEVFITKGDDNYFDNNMTHASIFSGMSRNSSFVTQSSTPRKDWDNNTLSRVPSYDKAMKLHSSTVDDLPPLYPDETVLTEPSIINLEKPQGVRHRGLSTSSTNSTSRSGVFKGIMSKSNNSSSSSLNRLTRSSSANSFNLSANPSSSGAKNLTVTKQYGFSMTPYGTDDNVKPDSRLRTGSLNSFSEFFSR